MDLKENERLDDLQYKGLKIIQNTKGFCFGIDSVLLTDFAKKIKPNSLVADLGSGTGILSILLAAKTQNTKFIGIEIQQEVADMSRRSIEYNKLNDRINIENCNILELKEKIDNISVIDKMSKVAEMPSSQEFDYAINVLISLGLTKYDATKRIRELASPQDKAEDIIQKVLRSL